VTMVVSEEDRSRSILDGDSSGIDDWVVVESTGDGCGLGLDVSLTGVGGTTSRAGESMQKKY